jgi:hypothetical protein
MKNNIIVVNNISIGISSDKNDDYICISDIAKAKIGNTVSKDVVKKWLRNRNTLEFLGTWESIYNPNFKVFESEHFRKQVGLLTFTLSPSEWVDRTNAIGMFV